MAKWTPAGLALGAVCGFVFVAAAVSSDGLDLRPEGGDVATILADRSRVAEQRQVAITTLQEEIDALGRLSNSETLKAEQARVAENIVGAGLTPLTGPGLQVVLHDAPLNVEAPGLDPNLLVVHQQDLQAVVNALWQGGAEAITLQGQRLTATTGIKCVGNTVVLQGVPYAPPYVIEAIGPATALQQGLAASPEVVTYAEYAERYGLGFTRTVRTSIEAPAFHGVTELRHASVID